MQTEKTSQSLLAKLWQDDAGVILSAEIVLVATILVIGMIVGLVELQCAVVGELSDLGDAISAVCRSCAWVGRSARED